MSIISRSPKSAKSLTTQWREILFVVATLLIANIVFDVAYRAYQFWTLPGRLFNIVVEQTTKSQSSAAAQPAQFYVPDAYAGYVYAPNFEGRRGHPWYSHWRTNSYGHVSQFEYPKEKPAGEYRIAVVGDSMTADVTNNIRWTELLEEKLNASPKWKRHVGDKFTRVINFAVDGTGMIQFAGMVRHHVPPFEPDQIIVNFVSDDILRRMRFPAGAGALTDREASIRAYVNTYLEQINWFSPCPELFVATVGHMFGLKCALPMDAKELLASQSDQKYTDRREAIRTSIMAVNDMISVFPNILFLQIPLYHELDHYDIPDWRGLVEEVQRAVPRARITSMRPQLEKLLEGKLLKDRPDLAGMTLHQITALPDDRKLEIYRWFFLPEDAHYTDYGLTLYANEVVRYLIEN